MVVYLVCYDLGAQPDEQIHQLNYWLKYLNSTLQLSSPASRDGNWTLFIVGLRHDLEYPSSQGQNLDLKKLYPRLPIFDKQFKISSLKSNSTRDLFNTVRKECGRIFHSYSELVPKSHQKVLEAIQTKQTEQYIAKEEDMYNQNSLGCQKLTFTTSFNFCTILVELCS